MSHSSSSVDHSAPCEIVSYARFVEVQQRRARVVAELTRGASGATSDRLPGRTPTDECGTVPDERAAAIPPDAELHERPPA